WAGSEGRPFWFPFRSGSVLVPVPVLVPVLVPGVVLVLVLVLEVVLGTRAGAGFGAGYSRYTFVNDAWAVAVITISPMFTCAGRVAAHTIASATSAAVRPPLMPA